MLGKDLVCVVVGSTHMDNFTFDSFDLLKNFRIQAKQCKEVDLS